MDITQGEYILFVQNCKNWRKNSQEFTSQEFTSSQLSVKVDAHPWQWIFFCVATRVHSFSTTSTPKTLHRNPWRHRYVLWKLSPSLLRKLRKSPQSLVCEDISKELGYNRIVLIFLSACNAIWKINQSEKKKSLNWLDFYVWKLSQSKQKHTYVTRFHYVLWKFEGKLVKKGMDTHSKRTHDA